MTRTFKTEFPDFDYDLPQLAGWEDGSWHNDACPCLTREIGPDHFQTIYCDYRDPAKRELGDVPRFAFVVNKGIDSETLFETDDWQAMAEFASAYEVKP